MAVENKENRAERRGAVCSGDCPSICERCGAGFLPAAGEWNADGAKKVLDFSGTGHYIIAEVPPKDDESRKPGG